MQDNVYRFAPSPTGFLHVGGARTAIFNWLAAKSDRGQFLLRIEDTDMERSTRESVEQILSSLKWLGLSWDGEIIFQSRRYDRHREVAELLVKNGSAYHCFCGRDHLEQQKLRAQTDKNLYIYNGQCRDLSEAQIEEKRSAGVSSVVRLKVDPGATSFHDGIHGEISVSNDEIGDFVILRSDGSPVYQLAVVIDDNDMGVTHVLRGDDHISNTPKQILLYQALKWKIPKFSHLPLILGPDKVRLSKRHGASSVEEFRDQGILPDALFNYLCLLGWSPGDDREIICRQELSEIFSLKRVNKADAVFDFQKLLWMNSKYIVEASDVQILEIVGKDLDEQGRKKLSANPEAVTYLLRLVRPRSKTMIELRENIQFYLSDPLEYEQNGVDKFFNKEGQSLLNEVQNLLNLTSDFSVENLDLELRGCAQKLEIRAGKLFHPLRLALTGKTTSPGIFDIMYILGQETVLRRISKAIDFIKNR